MRRMLALCGLMLLAACASEPGSGSDLPVIGWLPQGITGLPGDPPQFGVAGLAQAPTQDGYASFNKASPDVAAVHAAQICTRGYEKLGEETLPGETVPFTRWTVRCNLYRPSL
jgi:hypothetical protein